MGDTPSSKIVEKVLYLTYLSRPRYDSTAELRIIFLGALILNLSQELSASAMRNLGILLDPTHQAYHNRWDP
jgi:hypothetical protein